VARLPTQGASHSKGGSSKHQVSLLLKADGEGIILFQAADPTSAPAEQPADSGALVINCIARGSWGTYLPLTVTWVEQGAEAEQDTDHRSAEAKEADGSLIALTVSPNTGKLWCMLTDVQVVLYAHAHGMTCWWFSCAPAA
jgi:hypothetical protein